MEIKSKKTFKGESKVVVKKEIKHDDYVHAIETNEALRKEVVSISSFSHQLYSFKQQKIALTLFYDKMKMIDNIGYNPSNAIPQEFPDAEPDEEDILNGEEEMLFDEVLRAKRR